MRGLASTTARDLLLASVRACVLDVGVVRLVGLAPGRRRADRRCILVDGPNALFFAD
jgi:hypothetical protein